ncbi:MAG: sodium/proton-translocating pyrophosphatase [Candidatus Margulisiibacteriota bacterium]
MTMINFMLALSIGTMVIALLGLKRMIKAPLGESMVESFVNLVGQSIRGFNRRLFQIFLQFIVVTNVIYTLLSWWANGAVDWMNVIAFDIAIMAFGGVIFVITLFFPNSISAILSPKNLDLNLMIQSVINAGTYQSLSFMGVFLSCLSLSICFLDKFSFLSVGVGLLVTSFYLRSAGGAYKAAAEHHQSFLTASNQSITHPTQILKSSGTIIASVAGLYLDIFGSWFIAIGAFLIFLVHKIEVNSFLTLIHFSEVQWVLAVVGFTMVSMILALPFSQLRKNKQNIFLEVGYIVILLTFIALLTFTHYLEIEAVHHFNLGVALMLVSMLGFVFFTIYLTSVNHKPIQYIARQAQFGSANVLISSFFNGLVGNAVFTILVILVLAFIYAQTGLIGMMMIIIYGLSIISVACFIKTFSTLSNELTQVLNFNRDSRVKPMIPALAKISYSLEAIGNAFSSVAGIATSVLLFSCAFSLSGASISVGAIQNLFAAGLGVVSINVFYALSISGTYQTLMISSKEIQRQLDEIPLISEQDKAHPNIQRLCDKHASNALKAISLPGIWIVITLLLFKLYLATQGIIAALAGMFCTVFIYSFFWSIFGDSVVAVFNAMREGQYGGKDTSVFKDVFQSYLYAHYFQWVLAPTGVIIMKLAGIIALAITLN